MIKEYIVKKVLDAALAKAKDILNEAGAEFHSKETDFADAIARHLQSVSIWSDEISFSDLAKAKTLTEVFIQLDLLLYPRRIAQPGEEIASIPLLQLFDESPGHFVILGQPGAGKTTSMKYLCYLLLHDDSYHTDRFAFPIVIKLRDIQKQDTDGASSILLEEIYSVLGFSIRIPGKTPPKERGELERRIRNVLTLNVLNELRVLLVLDGFDELPSEQHRNDVLIDIRQLAVNLSNSTMIVTSRSGDFVYSIDNAHKFEIASLSDSQIEIYARQWLNDEEAAADFLKKVRSSPFADTTIRPLTLAHLCAIYQRVGAIPEKPKSLYRKVINLLLEEWDQQRSVRRYSKYADFEVDRKFDFLCRLAFELTTSFHTTAFTEEQLQSVYLRICRSFDLKQHDVNYVVGELETHTGLIVQAGYHHYEFAHKSLQEYLTAEYLVRLPSIPDDKRTLLDLPNELAIAVTISSNSADYFSELILNRMGRHTLPEGFCKAFINRLILEKPDFSGFDTSLSLLILYSAFMVHRLNVGDVRLMRVDPVITEFEQLTRAAAHNNLNLLKSLYDVEKKLDADDDDVLVLTRKEVFRTVLADKVERFPNILYVRESFVSLLENTAI